MMVASLLVLSTVETPVPRTGALSIKGSHHERGRILGLLNAERRVSGFPAGPIAPIPTFRHRT
jgi:hypothetical protein